MLIRLSALVEGPCDPSTCLDVILHLVSMSGDASIPANDSASDVPEAQQDPTPSVEETPDAASPAASSASEISFAGRAGGSGIRVESALMLIRLSALVVGPLTLQHV